MDSSCPFCEGKKFCNDHKNKCLHKGCKTRSPDLVCTTHKDKYGFKFEEGNPQITFGIL